MTPIPKPTSSHQKGVKMKSPQTPAKKKVVMTKALNDSISDTISSVIQGKITHQKLEIKPTSPKKLVKNDKPKVIKKLCTNTNKAAVVVSSSAPSTPWKNDNVNVTRAHNAKVETQSSPKKQQEKPAKVALAPVKQLKPNVSVDVKSQIKPINVVKRQNSPGKVANTVADKATINNRSRDSSKDRSGNKTDVPEKKDKPPPVKKKVVVVNKTTKINKKILTEVKVKQKLASKPKKVVQSTSIKASMKKKKILVGKTAASRNKIIRKIPPKRKVLPSEDTSLSKNAHSEKASTVTSPLLKDDQIKSEPLDEQNSSKLVTVKQEHESDSDKKSPKVKSVSKMKSKTNSIIMKRLLSNQAVKNKKQSKKMKLYNMWNGPKRHRVASLNALAKVHCLYENESRGVLLDQMIYGVKKENGGKIKSEDESPCPSTRQLRTNPGLRGVGKHWEMHESSSSSSSPSSEEDEYEFKETNEKPCLRKIRRIRDLPKVKEKVAIESSDDSEPSAAPTKPKRPRKPKKKPDSPIMDLKDLIVPKRMASLNATAILAASYSVEKRSNRPPNSDSEDSSDSGDSYFKEPIPEDEQLEQIVKMEQQQAADERSKAALEAHAAPKSKKVAVILNQDTDVTITGVYVNSTRSTHHEGYCRIAGMQYRISATSHTQTAATAVTSETILQSASTAAEHNASCTNGDSSTASNAPCQHPSKSYTPLDALSSMQPPSTSTSSGSANNPPINGPPPPQQPPQHMGKHQAHGHAHHNSPPIGLPPPHHQQQQQQQQPPLPPQQYHHHHHHVSGGHYHHPHQLVVAQYPPHQYYPQHPPPPQQHGAGLLKGRYGLYHHHHHSSSSSSDRASSYASNTSGGDSSAFSVPPGGVFPSVTGAGAHGTSTASSGSSAAAPGQEQQPPPPPTASQLSAGSGSESEGIGSASGYVHGYYQPAGPLISLSHGHGQPAALVKTQPADPPSSISPLPPHKIQPPSSTGDSSDNEVIITSVTTIKDNSSATAAPSRHSPPLSQSLPPPPPSNYRSPYHPSQPYQPTTYATYPPAYGSPYHSPYYNPYPHHELCYPPGGYVAAHKYPPPPPPPPPSQASVYRRYLSSTAGGGYYVTTAPEMFGGQGPGPGPGPGGQGVSDVRAVADVGASSGPSSNSSGSYQTASPHQSGPQSSLSQSGQGQQPATIMETYTPPPPPSALLESYPPPPPPSHYYPGYGPAAPPPPNCYPHPHSSSRGVPFLNATYPPCPCPMQSCPKNVHTGPLTGDCKRSTALQIAKATALPPVALALPLEPASATGPPSPARGSAGMPPPPSPAGATYQPLPPSSDIPPVTTGSTVQRDMLLLPQLKNEQTSDSDSAPTINGDRTPTQTMEATTLEPSLVEVADVKPTEETKRRARVGKAMVRNSIQQQQMSCNIVNNGSMLLMCNPRGRDKATIDDHSSLRSVDVKREVISPEEVRHIHHHHHHQEVHHQVDEVGKTKKNGLNVEEILVAEDLTTTAKEPPKGQFQFNHSSLDTFSVQVETPIILDVKTEKIIEPLVTEVAVKSPPPIEVVLEPCQKTVAENVKVKNMKRKLSFNNNNNNNNNNEEKKVSHHEESPTPAKRSKQTTVNINNNIPNNGSYKDLIKKGNGTFKINNGKRRLITTNGGKLQSKLVPSKFPKKRTPVKRKASIPLKDETNSKRVKINPKPLATSNSKDSKNNDVKENTFIDTSLIENKEPSAKPKTKNGRKNNNQNSDKVIIIKSNVDRTIESVVNEHLRTEKRSRSRSNEKPLQLDDENTPLPNKRGSVTSVKAAPATKVPPPQPPPPPVISVTTVLIPSAVPSVESFLKPSAIPKAIASTSKSSHLSVPGTSNSKSAVAVASDLCGGTAGHSRQLFSPLVQRRRSGNSKCAVAPPAALSSSVVGSVASGTRSLMKASAAAALAAQTAAAQAAAVQVAIAPVGRAGSRRSAQQQLQPRWSNGWTWEGEPFQREVFLNSDDAVVLRKCYPAMRHREGDSIEPRDCVLLKAGPRKNDLPFVAKVAALWENPEDGEMMMSLLWYYRPEHTEQGRTCADQPDEVFASRHKDSNSVACIEDKCYVLTFNEYCRYRKTLKRLEEGLADTSPCIPLSEPYQRHCRQPPKAVPTSPEMIFFCRRVYDFRQKRIVKNPS